MVATSIKQLKSFMNQPLTGKAGRGCAVVMKTLLAACALVVLLGAILFTLNPQTHWMVFVARGSPEPPKDYTGTWITWGPSGKMIAQEQYSDGKLDGPSTQWDGDGRRQLETFYRAGELNGTWTTFRDNASVREFREFTSGIPTGHWIKFNESGTTNFEVFHSRPGARDGPEVSSTKTGERKVLRTWRNGSPWDGRFWSVSNQESILRIYDNGRLVSETNLGRYPSGPRRAIKKATP